MAETSQTPEGDRGFATRPRPGATGGRSLTQAVVTAVALLGAVAVSSWLGITAFFVLVCAVVALGLLEVLDALLKSGRRPVLPFALGCGLALPAVAYARRPALVALVMAVAAFGGFALALRPSRGATPASDVAWTLLAIAWVGGGGAAAAGILVMGDSGLALLIAFLLITALDDIAAYFVGTRWGGHKLAPSISPSKSWEGFAGGLAAALVGGLCAGLLVDELAAGHGLVLGALCGVLAPAGDLAESMFKREVGIKDSGRLLPGHGGFLDRLDAIIFCAPAVFLYLRWALP